MIWTIGGFTVLLLIWCALLAVRVLSLEERLNLLESRPTKLISARIDDKGHLQPDLSRRQRRALARRKS